jgi:2''-5'' RNA ligase
VIRLFAGLGLPSEVAERLAALSGGIPGARWVEARNHHITLRFFGEVEEGVAADLHDGLAAVRAPAFALSLTGFGTFGRGNPNHLWAAADKAPALFHLQAKVEQAAVQAGLAPEGRKYLPHVTLARFRAAPVARIQDFIARNSPFQAGPWPVKNFVLYRSHLGRGGAEYEALAEYPLE